jgi:outer membrane phospholipase A
MGLLGAVLVGVAILGACQAAAAQGLTPVFLVPTEPASPGGQLSVWLIVLNGSDRAGTYTFPRSLEFLLRLGERATTQVGGLRNPGDAGGTVIPPGGHMRREYLIPMPEGMEGSVVLSARAVGANPVAVEVRHAAATAPSQPPGGDAAKASAAPPPAPAPTGEEPASTRFFKEHFFGHEPFYFAAGPEYPNAKFQISFKYRLFSDTGYLATHYPAVSGLHIAYTQTSLWDLEATSKPFVDTSYKPEVLYRLDRIDGGRWADWLRLDLQIGAGHESNGKSGADSRSLNIAYFEPTLWLGKPDDFRFSIAPRVWTYLGSLDENPTIKDYRGFVGLRSTLGWDQGLLLSATGRLGDDGNKGSLQLDLSYPLMQLLSRSLSLYLYGQYFTGHGESLLRYDERSWAVRFGFAIVR